MQELIFTALVPHPPILVPAVGGADLDPSVFGVTVASGARTGLLLPALPGVDTVEEQMDIVCRKAGVRPDDPDLKLRRFKVTRLI